MSRFGEKLVKLREARGITIKEVCAQVGIPQSRLSELEKGIRIPTPGQSEKLAKFYEISINDLDASAHLE
jgi:transcriptional regulator with XRE-family HTH domain